MNRAQRAELLHGIYVILNQEPRVLALAAAVLDAGVRIVQYRAKNGIRVRTVRALRARTRDCGALLILNDDWRAANEFDCDGVHLGPGDDGFGQIARVRDALDGRLIGLSCGTLAEVNTANTSDIDYLGVGSVRATNSKADAGTPIGIEGLRTLVNASAVPVAAVGGITAAAIPQILDAGAAMAAVISSVSNASDPQHAARELVDAWRR
jgi:thiamine-phosphate diphosphorylase